MSKRSMLLALFLLFSGQALAELPSSDKLAGLKEKLSQRLEHKSLVNGGGKCLDINGPDLNRNGGKVQIWDCADVPNQKWRFDDAGRLVNKGGKCLDIHGPDLHTNGGKVQIWDCGDVPNQKWRLENGHLKNEGGKCLDVNGPDLHTNGGKVQIWDCADVPNQRWELR